MTGPEDNLFADRVFGLGRPDADPVHERQFADQVAAGLRAAVLELEPSPGTVPAASRAGRRRLVRRRQAAVGTGLVAVLAGVALTPRAVAGLEQWQQRVTSATPGPHTATPVEGGLYAALYDASPRGDRVQDRTYVAAVLDAWNASHKASVNAERGIFKDLRGEPRVVWAADTPAGPAAAVVQRAVLHAGTDLSKLEAGPSALIGLVGVDAEGRPRVVADDYWKSDNVEGRYPMAVWAVDPERTVLAALDLGRPVGWSDRWSYRDNGSRSMTFSPIPLRDGGGSVQLPDTFARAGFVATWLPYRTFEDSLTTGGILPPQEELDHDRRLQWAGPGGTGNLHLGGTQDVDVTEPQDLLGGALERRTQGIVTSEAYPLWTATGRLPDGRNLIAGDDQLGSDPSHAYVLITAGAGQPERVVHGGPVDLEAALPFQVRLPDGLGTVVAHKGATLSWRASPSDPWSASGQDAALIPDRATQVRVVFDGQDLVTSLRV